MLARPPVWCGMMGLDSLMGRHGVWRNDSVLVLDTRGEGLIPSSPIGLTHLKVLFGRGIMVLLMFWGHEIRVRFSTPAL